MKIPKTVRQSLTLSNRTHHESNSVNSEITAKEIEFNTQRILPVLSTAFDKYVGKVPRAVFHYTSLETLCRMLEPGMRSIDTFRLESWRGGNIRTQNDPTEGTFHEALEELLPQRFLSDSIWLSTIGFDQSMKDHLANLSAETFSISLSEHSDSLDLWTRYGNDGNGVAIELDASRLSELSADPENMIGFSRVMYSADAAVDVLLGALLEHETTLTTFYLSSGTEIKNSLEAATLAKLYSIQLLGPFCKSNTYASEKEWRIAFTRKPSELRHFHVRAGLLRSMHELEIPGDECLVKSITLGPKISNQHNKTQLQKWLQMFPMCSEVEVKMSSVPYC